MTDFEKRRKRIVEDAKRMTYAAVGRKYGLSRQRVAVIVAGAAPKLAEGRRKTAPITVQEERELAMVLDARGPQSWTALAGYMGVTVARVRRIARAAELEAAAETRFVEALVQERSDAADRAVWAYRAWVEKHGARPTVAEVMRSPAMRKAKRFKGTWLNRLRMAAGDVAVLPGRPSNGGMPLKLQKPDPTLLLDG